MANLPAFAPTPSEVVEKRYSMIQCYLSKELKVYEILQKFRVTNPDFYKYLDRFHKYGKADLQNIKRGARTPHNKKPSEIETEIVSWHRKHPYFSSYELNQLTSVNPRTIQRIIKRKKLPDETLVFQCTIEDDYSRGYAGCLSNYKDARIVVYALIDAVLRWKAIPTLVENPKGNGKKER